MPKSPENGTWPTGRQTHDLHGSLVLDNAWPDGFLLSGGACGCCLDQPAQVPSGEFCLLDEIQSFGLSNEIGGGFAILATHLFWFQVWIKECFWKLHNVAIILWPLLLFFHGSQGWVGIGIPLVILVCGLPMLLYAATRVARLIRL